jgi:hypothetical protein
MEKSAHSSADKIALYDELVATCRSVERKGGYRPIHCAQWSHVQLFIEVGSAGTSASRRCARSLPE